MGEGYGDTVVTFLERADNATLDVVAEILSLNAASVSRNTRSNMPLPKSFGGMGVGVFVALLAGAAYVRSASLSVGSAIRCLTTQDARARGDTHDDVPMKPVMYGRLTTAMNTTVSRRPGAQNGDDSDSEPMWSLQLASTWVRLLATCGSHAFTEFKPLITTALAIFPPKRPTVAFVGCPTEARPNNEHITRRALE
jgi:hypothetical protein